MFMQKSFYVRNFEHYYIPNLQSKFQFMSIFIWKHQIQPSCDMTRKCLKNKANGSVKCTRARKKQLWKSTLESLKKMWRKNKTAALVTFFSTNMASIQKRKKWSNIIMLKNSKFNFELHWWTFMIAKNKMALVTVGKSWYHIALNVQKQVFKGSESH